MRRELYPWQEECLQEWFANQGRGMVQAVTGSGKTLLALTAADRLEKKLSVPLKVKIVVPTGALMHQWTRELKNYLQESTLKPAEPSAPAQAESLPEAEGEGSESAVGIRKTPEETDPAPARENPRQMIGLRGNGCNSTADHKYMIYVINSARYELAKQILADLAGGAAVLLIADECHRYVSEQNRLIFEFLSHSKPYENRVFSLGLSATLPSGRAQNFLTSVLGRPVYRFGFRQAIEMRTVCDYDIFNITLSFLPQEAEEYERTSDTMSYLYAKLADADPLLKELTRKEFFEELRLLTGDQDPEIAEAAKKYLICTYHRKNLVVLASSRIPCACDLIRKLPQTEKILVFGERIRQADDLYVRLQQEYPGRVARYHSQMGAQANANAMERFRNGEIRILVACKALDEGIDVPDASIGIVLSSTSVQRQRIQRLGRIVRNSKDKERASLYYLHLSYTSEEVWFLPDYGENRFFDLTFTSLGTFQNPPYDQAAQKLLLDFQRLGASRETLAEVRRCLQVGQVRADWCADPEELKHKIESAKDTAQRNYWICMLRLSRKNPLIHTLPETEYPPQKPLFPVR